MCVEVYCRSITNHGRNGIIAKAPTLTAKQFCMSQKKTVLVQNLAEAQPPFVLGNFPKADVQFTCVVQ